MKQPSYSCFCIACRKPYSSLGIPTHFMRSHGTKEQQDLFKNAALAKKVTSSKLQSTYYQTPNCCKECNSIIPYDKRINIFCSHTCSATATNRARKKSGYSLSESSRNSIRDKLSIFSGPYTKIYIKPCKFCSKSFVTARRERVCKDCQHLKWYNNKDQYSFKFNIFDYPDLFDLSQLKIIGWVSFGGKRGGTKNPEGLSRDHKVSVNHAKLYNYNPYYISHPLNCELMLHIENNKKKTRSSITYDELVRIVDEYDNRGDH